MRYDWLIALAVVATMGGTTPILAQAPAAAPHRSDAFAQAMSQLDLNATQKAKIQQIMDNPNLQGPGRRRAVLAVLTPEQQNQLGKLARAHAAPTPVKH